MYMISEYTLPLPVLTVEITGLSVDSLIMLIQIFIRGRGNG